MIMEWIRYSTYAVILGFGFDLIVGDPQGWPHIVRGYGWLVSNLEGWLYPLTNKRVGGSLLVVLVLLASIFLPSLLLVLAWQVSPWLFLLIESLLCWQLLAVKSLRVESGPVYDSLIRGDLVGAREALSRIVGRDTAELDETGVTKAAVETVAENLADGVAAPLLYMLLGGSLLGCAYKAINTMDSMIAYKNDRYLEFGRTAARIDDIANYIPARLCALAMVASAALTGMNPGRAFKIWRRDRYNHASPNSAQTEAVMAGALGIELAGDAWYFGRLVKKPSIGDPIRPVEAKDILRAHRLLYMTSVLLLVGVIAVRGVIYAAI